MNANTDNSLTADHLSNFKDLLVSVGYSHARQWLQSERELALPDEEIEIQYDRWRDDNLPVPQWHDLLESLKDEFRDVYLDSFREGVSGPAPSPSDKELLVEARTALEVLIKHVERNTCAHEEVHRGGSIWTICDGCGMEWSDDEGGMPKSFPMPLPFQKAESTLQKLQSATR